MTGMWLSVVVGDGRVYSFRTSLAGPPGVGTDCSRDEAAGTARAATASLITLLSCVRAGLSAADPARP